VLVRLSSKGQVVIPIMVRRVLRLSPGAELSLEVVDRKIVLVPVETTSPTDVLYGRSSGHDLLGDLEREHEVEIERAARPPASLTPY
jgi:AbrB family looped-hinge helix DNA binding protein